MSEIDDEIALKTLTGDYYPNMIGGGVGSGESVNIAGNVLKTVDDWIGFRLHVMCPGEREAKRLITPLVLVIKNLGFGSGRIFEKQLQEAPHERDPWPINHIWTKECGELVRRGIVRA